MKTRVSVKRRRVGFASDDVCNELSTGTRGTDITYHSRPIRWAAHSLHGSNQEQQPLSRQTCYLPFPHPHTTPQSGNHHAVLIIILIATHAYSGQPNESSRDVPGGTLLLRGASSAGSAPPHGLACVRRPCGFARRGRRGQEWMAWWRRWRRRSARCRYASPAGGARPRQTQPRGRRVWSALLAVAARRHPFAASSTWREAAWVRGW